jgi:hypothetical protein
MTFLQSISKAFKEIQSHSKGLGKKISFCGVEECGGKRSPTTFSLLVNRPFFLCPFVVANIRAAILPLLGERAGERAS